MLLSLFYSLVEDQPLVMAWTSDRVIDNRQNYEVGTSLDSAVLKLIKEAGQRQEAELNCLCIVLENEFCQGWHLNP